MYRTQVVWLEVDALYALKGGGFSEAVGVGQYIDHNLGLSVTFYKREHSDIGIQLS